MRTSLGFTTSYKSLYFVHPPQLADGNPNQVFAILLVNGNGEKLQQDSGTTVNIIADKTVKNRYAENGIMTRRNFEQ